MECCSVKGVSVCPLGTGLENVHSTVSGVVNVGGGERRGGECRTILFLNTITLCGFFCVKLPMSKLEHETVFSNHAHDLVSGDTRKGPRIC